MRNYRIDAFRLYTLFLVGWAHIEFLEEFSPKSLPTKVLQLAIIIGVRYTIPFFFIVSGYFVGGKMALEPSNAIPIAVKSSKKLVQAFLFWSMIYAIEQPKKFLYLVQQRPFKLLFEGTEIHLWFLVALFLTIWLFALWPFKMKSYHFLLLGIALYICGLLGGSYKATPIGFDMHFKTRDALFFGTVFFAIGIMFRNKTPRVSKKMALGIALTGLLIFCLEAFYLRSHWQITTISHDYLLGSIPFGIGVSLFVFNHQETRLDRLAGPYGRYMLGIYTSHVLFINLLRPLGSIVQSTLWLFIFPILVFGCSLLFSIIMARTPLRNVVV